MCSREGASQAGWHRLRTGGYFVWLQADGKFVPAEAKIDGNTVLVSIADVPKRAAVRYAWADLPASPFRAGAGQSGLAN